ncbi:MAG: GvpL/GvpF family gas vesicle protein [Chloroflexota bacterium]|nr:GvpL/GvpF family gas vesicle protein [Chloroflexota bacterium]
MSRRYLYAITDRPEAPLPVIPAIAKGIVENGPEGPPPTSLAYRDIAAVISPLTVSEVPATEANLWRHEAVVESLMADRTVLPVRFGTVLADETAVRSFLAARYAGFVAGLQRVRGRVELGLRVLWEIADSEWQMADRNHQPSAIGHQPSAISGREYLLARLEEEHRTQAQRQRAEALAAALHAPLSRLAAENIQQVLVTPSLLLKAAYLVERGRVTSFQQETEALSAAYPSLHFVCTGPWPAYSFVTAVMQESNDGGL